MTRLAFSVVLVSLASALAITGCAARSDSGSDSDSTSDEPSALDLKKGCVYASTGHVILCVPPPDPSTHSSPGWISPPAHGGGGPSSHVDCDALADHVDELLAAAQACSLAPSTPTAAAACQDFVPTTSGCEAPVALPGSDATKKYLQAWAGYAAICPVPHPPCVAPEGLDTACVQGSSPATPAACAIVDE